MTCRWLQSTGNPWARAERAMAEARTPPATRMTFLPKLLTSIACLLVRSANRFPFRKVSTYLRRTRPSKRDRNPRAIIAVFGVAQRRDRRHLALRPIVENRLRAIDHEAPRFIRADDFSAARGPSARSGGRCRSCAHRWRGCGRDLRRASSRRNSCAALPKRPFRLPAVTCIHTPVLTSATNTS